MATLGLAIWVVGIRRNLESVVCVAAYIAASEVLWRMTKASVPWEASKLALIVVFAVAAVRLLRRPRRVGLPLLLVVLLVPSATVTVLRLGVLGNGRERLTFELAAHVALAMGVIVLSCLRIERQKLAGVLWMVVGPVLAVNTIATAGTIGLQSTDFSGGLSNAASSGGYGPNQVSACIGVGAMVCVFLVYFDRRPVLRLIAAGLAFWFLAQSVLTFSRGGSFNLIVALVAATPWFLRNIRVAVRFLATVTVLILFIVFGMIPVMQRITGDQFGQRFTSSDPTLRTDLMRAEVSTWADNVGLGIGVGMMERTVADQGAADRGDLPTLPTHTEFTRLLAEHGLLGLAAILVLIALAVRNVRDQVLPEGQILSVVLVAWCASEVSHSATRLALVPFLFALASAVLVPNGSLQPSGHLSGPGQRQDPVKGDGPPAAARPRLGQRRPGELPAAGEERQAVDRPLSEAVKAPEDERE